MKKSISKEEVAEIEQQIYELNDKGEHVKATCLHIKLNNQIDRYKHNHPSSKYVRI